MNRIDSGIFACSSDEIIGVHGRAEPAHCWHEVVANRCLSLNSGTAGLSRLISFVLSGLH